MKKILFSCILTAVTVSIFALWDMDWSDAGQLNMTVTNFGILGHNVQMGTGGGYWPAGYPAEKYIYGSGLWFGAIVDTFISGSDTLRDTLVTCGYNPNSGDSEFSPGDGDDAPLYDDIYDVVYRSDTDLWYDSNAPAEKPDTVISSLDTWAMYNDLDQNNHFIPENRPIGLLVKQTTYSLYGPIVEDIIIVQFCIKNVRADGRDLMNCYIGFAADLDIGNESGDAANDILGFMDTMTVDFAGSNDTLMQINTGYQFQLESEGGWVHTPGIASIVFLDSPLATDSIDLYHNGSYIIPAGNPIGLTSMNSFTLSTDPSTKQERYQVMAGYNHLTFNPSNPEASYQPFPSWGTGVAGYPGQTESPAYASDKRFVMASGPFDIAYGDSVFFVAAYSVSPDTSSLLNHSLTTIDLWNNCINNIVTVYAPADSAEINSFTDFTWAPVPDKDSFHIYIKNARDTLSYNYSGFNTGTYSMNTSVIPDGLYDWYINNYNLTYYESHSYRRNCIINNTGSNFPPYICWLSAYIDNDRSYLDWDIIEPEDDSIMTSVQYIRSLTGDTVYSAATYGRHISFSAYNNLPDGGYKVLLTVEDDSSAVDTAYTTISYFSTHPTDTSYQNEGDNDLVEIEVLTYNSSLVTQHLYSVDFNFPYQDNSYLYLPFTVIDHNDMSVVLVDTARYYCQPLSDVNFTQYFDTDIFDGIGLRIYIDSLYPAGYDSVAVINDVGNAYPESLLTLFDQCNVFSGRDMDIFWHHYGDSIYADVLPAFYSDSLDLQDPMIDYNYAYCFGSNTSPSPYLNRSTTTLYYMYVAGVRIAFNYTTRYYPMQADWYPDEGEVWRLYSSGQKLAISGDSYLFTPSGIVDIIHDNEIPLQMIITSGISSGVFEFTIKGTGNVDIALYDVSGRFVDNLYAGKVNGYSSSSKHLNLMPGVYFIKDRLNSDISGKIILIK